jgi:hypothetical protein
MRGFSLLDCGSRRLLSGLMLSSFLFGWSGGHRGGRQSTRMSRTRRSRRSGVSPARYGCLPFDGPFRIGETRPVFKGEGGERGPDAALPWCDACTGASARGEPRADDCSPGQNARCGRDGRQEKPDHVFLIQLKLAAMLGTLTKGGALLALLPARSKPVDDEARRD